MTLWGGGGSRVSRKRVLTVVRGCNAKNLVYHEAFEDLETCKFLPRLDANDPEVGSKLKQRVKLNMASL